MLGKPLSALCAVALCCAPCVVPAANFTVSNPADFQQRLNDAAGNGENDTITVEECLGTGCVTVGQFSVYDIVTPLTFTSTEGRSLIINGTDSNTRILRGGSNNNSGILFIDTSGAADDFDAEVVVSGLTIVEGNNVGDNGGGLNIHVNLARVTVSASVFGGNLIEGDPFGGNAADGDGGALYIRADQAGEFPILISDVTFDSNSAGGGGGGAHISALGPVQIRDVFFWDNDAANGGGLEVQGTDPNDPVFAQTSSVNLFDIDFDDNIARSGNGGGADISAGAVDINVVGFVRNLASSGSGAGLNLRRLFGSLYVVNTGFAYNLAGVDGGGFALESNMAFNLRFINNTVYGNQAAVRGGGGLLTIGGSTGLAQVYNNIIYGNTGASAGDDIYIDNDPFDDIPSTVNFFNNHITDLAGFPDQSEYFAIASAAELNSDFNQGGDPLLTLMTEVSPDPHQSQNSPTIDQGDDNAPGVPNEDYEFQDRPSGNAVDIGMDEYLAGTLPETDLSVTKTDNPDPVIGGQNVTYTVTVTNNGPDDATGVTVVDTLDVNSTFVSATFNQGTPCTTQVTPQQPTVVTCVLGALAASNSAPGTIVVTSSDDPLVTGIANSVTVSGNETDSTAANNTAQEGTTVVEDAGPPQADLAVTKLDSPDPVFSGGPVLTYSITVNNNGPDTATGVTVTDTLPVESAFQSIATTAGTCDTAPVNGDISCDLGDLASGSNATVTLVVDPDDVTSEDSISNTASVSATTEDPNLTNNTVTELTTVNPPGSDMSVGTTHSPTSPMIDEQFTYSITVNNDGPSDNTGVVLTVTLPAEVTFESVSIDTGSCDVKSDTVTCVIGDMASGVSVVAQIVVTAPGEPTTLTLSATLVADVDDPTPEDNVSSEAVIVIDVIDIIIEGTSEGAGSITLLELMFAAIVGAAIYWHRRREAAGRLLSAIGLVAIAMLLALPAQQAAAQWYVGASIGGSDADYSAGELQSDLSSLGWTINNPSVDDTDTAWKAYAGFSFNEFIATEAGYADLGKAKTRFGATVAPDEIDAILSDTFSIHPVLGDGWFGTVVLSWPVSPNQFSLTARAGFFVWEADIDVEVVQGGTGRVSGDEDGTDLLYGVGFEWHMNEQWSLTGEWERYEMEDTVDVPSIGVKYNF